MATIKKYNGSTWENTTARKYETKSEIITPPTTIYTDGTAITSYTISGNTIQNGTPTPTNPVDAVGVGTLDSGQYKIPISSGGVTTNIYLGSTQMVRQIKKLVLTGDEYWVYQANNLRFVMTINNIVVSGLRATPFFCTHYIPISDGRPIEDVPLNAAYLAAVMTNTATLNIKIDTYTTAADFKAYLAAQYANGTPVTVWYVLATPETAAVNEPLMKIGTYADTLSNAASIPTTEGANSITVDTAVQPSEFTATWTGWHNATVKEYEGGVGNNKFDEQYPDISTTIVYRPIYVGDGTFTMSSTVGREGTSAVLYFLAGNVGTGAHNSTNSVYDGQNRTQTAVEGYVTVAYRYIETLSPENYDTMLSKGSTALPYEPYEYGWE